MNMRAKMYITQIKPASTSPEQTTNMETVSFGCVSDKPYNTEGESEDNTFARYTPSGELSITINNPNLIGKFKKWQKFYLDFTEAPDSPKS